MATYTKFQPYIEHLHEGVHDFSTDTLVVALSNTAPAGTEATLSSITEIAYTNLSSRTITTSSHAQTGGTFKLVLADLVLTASGAVATFRYVIIYNSTASGQTNPLICYFDYGSGVTLANTETFTCDFNQTDGLFSAS